MKVPFTKPYFPKKMKSNILSSISEIMDNKSLMLGKYSCTLEEKFAKLIGVKYAVAVNSATTGLQISLRYGKTKGKEVIVPAASFITNVSSVLFENAKPVLVECEKETLTYNIEELKKKINKNTAAIVLVHLTGYIGNKYKKIIQIAKENDILLIEDCSHAHGSHIGKQYAGSMGDVGVFSFYPTKVLTSGTGGILTTNNEEIYKLAKSLRLFGKNDSNEVNKLGNDWFLDEFRSAICLSQLDMIESIIEKRSKAANYYIENLPKSKLFSFLKLKYDQKSCWYNFPIFFKSLENKNIFKAELSKKFISSKSIYRPVFEEKVFLKYNLGKNYKATKEMLDHSLCLPMYTSISKKELDYIIKIFNNIIDDI